MFYLKGFKTQYFLLLLRCTKKYNSVFSTAYLFLFSNTIPADGSGKGDWWGWEKPNLDFFLRKPH